MSKIKRLSPKYFRQTISPAQFKFKNTGTVKPLTDFLGQERAVESLLFGIGIQSTGYNLYAMGPPGIGKRSLISHVLTDYAHDIPVPYDWCYIHNFSEPEKPIALSLPPGWGYKFQKDMNIFITDLGKALLTVYESEKYLSSIRKISSYFDAKRSQNTKKTKQHKIDRTLSLYKQQHIKEKEVLDKSLLTTLKPHIQKLKQKYKEYSLITRFLDKVLDDVLAHASDYIFKDEKTNLFTYLSEHTGLIRYKVNLLVNNKKLKGAPIIFEEAPSYSTLIARIEHVTDNGVLVTNYTLIKSGALHLANGGYLILEARKLLRNREAWEALKSALYSRQIKIKVIEHANDTIKPVSLDPMPIPLNVKIILLGDRNTYYNLCQKDCDFIELFKVPVDFDEAIDRNKSNVQHYARLLSTIIQHKQLMHFDTTAVAAVLNQSIRLAEDVEKLTTYISEIEDLMIEADYWAKQRNKKIVKSKDVNQAIKAKHHRMDRSQNLYYEDIQRQFIVIKTTGKVVGQVNCLSVRRVGNFSYGHPTRVTARTRLGKGKLVDIQREIKMAGPLHTKAGLIISNFLASRFNSQYPFSLHASIAFEQLYCWTDGDSASVGELCALLSAIANIPLHQSLAVTGAIDQNGIVQAVGGINEKIEGFFDICQERGLTGRQGVIMPRVNIKSLMLREDIQRAAVKNLFHIYPIDTVDEAVSLLTGLEVEMVYSKIQTQLEKFAKTPRVKKS